MNFVSKNAEFTLKVTILQANRDLAVAQQEQLAANEQYDANARAIESLEEKVEDNRERMAALQS